ncbi:hypothetical protein B7463_g10789, partial [Scytalidium lignicola]
MAGVQFDDLNLEQQYDLWIAYAHTKTANIYMANETDRRYGPQGLHATSVMSGSFTSSLQRYQSDLEKNARAQDPRVADLMMSTTQGAATTVLAAVGSAFRNAGGVCLN